MTARRMDWFLFQLIAPRLIKHVRTVDPKSAEGLVAEVYHQVARDFEIVPPLTVHSSAPEVLAAVWAVLRESMLVGPAIRLEKEAIAAAISLANRCPFCVDVHSTMLYGGGEPELAKAMFNRQTAGTSGSHLQSMISWAQGTGSQATARQEPPFSCEDAPQLIGTAVGFHYINRMVNVFLHESPYPLPRALGWLKRPMAWLGGKFVGRPLVHRAVQPGESLALLPDAELPQEFAWSSDDKNVAGAFARFASTIERGGVESLTEPVRALVRQRVDGWNGEAPGLSRHWVDEAVSELNPKDKPAGRPSNPADSTRVLPARS